MDRKSRSLIYAVLAAVFLAGANFPGSAADVTDEELERLKEEEARRFRMEAGPEAEPTEAERLRRQNVVLKSEKGKAIRELRDTERELELQRGQLSQAKDRVRALEDELFLSTGERKTKEEKIEEYEGIFEAQRVKYKELEEAKKKLDEEARAYAAAKKTLASREEALKQAKGKIGALETDLAAKTEKMSAGDEKMKTLSEKIGTLELDLRDKEAQEKKLAELKTRLEGLIGQDAEITRTLAEYREKYGEKEAEAEKLTKKLESTEKKLKGEADKVKSLEAVQTKYKELKSRSKARMKSLESALKKVGKTAEGVYADLKAKNKAKVKSLENEFRKSAKAAEAKYKKLESELLRKTKEAESLDKKLKALNLKIELEKERLRVASENKKLKGEIADLKNQIKLAKKEKKTLEATTDEATLAKTLAERKDTLSREKLKVLTEDMYKNLVDMHYNVAVVYDKNGMYKEAEREYLECLKIDPRDSGVHYNLGILYDDKLGECKKAIKHYEKFLELRPMGEDAAHVKQWIFNIEQESRIGPHTR